MTTSTVAAVVDQTTDAGFRTWVAEVIHELVTTCGLTQTADTGQINTATVTRAAIASVAGYSIFRFNDTLQATVPIFIKLEYGSAAAQTTPLMMITVGQGSNGSGTLTGNLSARVSISGGIPGSSVTVYNSRYCYNATDGALAMAWKQGSLGVHCAGGFVLSRFTDNAGASAGTGYLLLSTNAATLTAAATGGAAQCYSIASAAWLTLTGAINWAALPFNMTSLLTGGNNYACPAWFLSPVPGIMATVALGPLGDFSIGTTYVIALVGGTTHTFISVGNLWGNTTPAGFTACTILIIWE